MEAILSSDVHVTKSYVTSPEPPGVTIWCHKCAGNLKDKSHNFCVRHSSDIARCTVLDHICF